MEVLVKNMSEMGNIKEFRKESEGKWTILVCDRTDLLYREQDCELSDISINHLKHNMWFAQCASEIIFVDGIKMIVLKHRAA